MAVAAGIFRQYDIRGIVGRDLTPDAARAIGGAYAAYLRQQRIGGGERLGPVSVGRDQPPSGRQLRGALADGLTRAAAEGGSIGVVPAPRDYWRPHRRAGHG